MAVSPHASSWNRRRGRWLDFRRIKRVVGGAALFFLALTVVSLQKKIEPTIDTIETSVVRVARAVSPWTPAPSKSVATARSAPPKPRQGFDLPSISNSAFEAGEVLHYHVIFKGMTVGHATLRVADGPLVEGRPTYQFTSTTRSISLFDHIMKVRDFNSSTVDKASLASISFHQNLHEGDYSAVRNMKFDNHLKKFHTEETEDGRTITRNGELGAPLHDVLAALFRARTMPLKAGEDTAVRIYRDGKAFVMKVTIDPKMPMIHTPLGTVRCLRVEPLVKGDSIFRSKDGRLIVYLTDDERKVPVLIEARITVGTVRVRLVSDESLN
jgi:hypothetical protein